MHRFLIGFIILTLLGTWQNHAKAQETTSFSKSINVDFSYGLPYYFGDFSALGGSPEPYLNVPISFFRVYNLSTYAGSVSYPITSWLSTRIKVSYSSIYYSSKVAFLHFKNSSIDFSLLPQLNFEFGRTMVYTYLGGGYNSMYHAKIFDTQAELDKNSNNARTWGISSTAGFGVNVRVYKNIALFIEGDFMFTGSDDFDGWRGADFNTSTGEAEKQKLYFSRDRIAAGRGGIRISFGGKSKPVGERRILDPVSSYYENPETEIKKVKEESIVPAVWAELGVKETIKGVTWQVNKAYTPDDLKIQIAAAEKVLSQIQTRYPTANMQLLWEPYGEGESVAAASIHFGGFKTKFDIESSRNFILRYYSGVVRRKG